MLSYFVILFFVVCYFLVMCMFSFCFVCSIVELYRLVCDASVLSCDVAGGFPSAHVVCRCSPQHVCSVCFSCMRRFCVALVFHYVCVFCVDVCIVFCRPFLRISYFGLSIV